MVTPRLVLILLVSLSTAARADWKDDVGYTRLQQTFATGIPTTVAAGVTQVEAADSNGAYLPDAANSQFSGKTILNQSSGSGVSGHATSAGTSFYGNTGSVFPGVTAIDAYSAIGWMQSDFLNFGIAAAPKLETRAVQNHSWIGASGNTDAVVTEINHRLDFAINRDGFVSVVGVNNGTTTSTTLPQLLAQSYHTISVGLVNGAHSAGFTTHDGAGRIKPDIVAPDTVTSFSTPKVASAAGLLYARLAAAPYSLVGADRSRTVKALLMATARKDVVASWSNTPTRPLDLRYGAGALNIYNAYTTLMSGRVSASDTLHAPARAWAAESIGGEAVQTYFFSIPPGTPGTPLSAVLTWHRVVTGSAASTMANLNLRLHAAASFSVGSLIAESASTVDNVELVYQATLAPGDYALVVENLSETTTPYALAWHSRPAVSADASVSVASELGQQPGMVELVRTGDAALPLIVPLSIGGTAIPGTHYHALPSTVTFAAGQTTVAVAVTPITDDIAQGDRTVTVSIAPDFTLVTDPAQSATVIIEDKPYDAWRFARFTTAQLADPLVSGDAADPDGDGLPNLLEYAFDTEPATADPASSAPLVGTAADRLTLAYTRPTIPPVDIGYVVEWSDDLLTWATGASVTETVSSTDNGAGTTTVLTRSVATLSDTPRQFLRLRVTRE